jgi:hypothetical protein
MNSTGLRVLADWLAWGGARIGRPGQIGLALALLGVAACVYLVEPMQLEIESTRARADRLAKQPPPPPREVADQAWMASLPLRHAGHAYLARLFAAAEKAGLELEEGRYRETRDADSGLTRLSISLPVNGEYRAIRAFLAHALEKEPSLALEGARLTRESIGDSEIRAELRLVLFLAGGA